MVGHRVANRDSIPSAYICVRCDLLLRAPRQSFCGHLFCQSCIDTHNKPVFLCPNCSELVQKEKCLIDLGIFRDMKPLPIQCYWCDWNGRFEVYDNHVQVFHPSPRCPHCQLQFSSMREFDGHMQATRIRCSVPCTPDSSSSTHSASQETSEHDASIALRGGRMIGRSRRSVKSFSTCTEAVRSSEVPRITAEQRTNDALPSQQRYRSYVWRIDNFEEKTANAEAGREFSIDSPPFYSPEGYKFCMRLYLDGDGSVRGSYASLHMVLMKGEFDQLLSFPFTRKVLFCLYDQIDRINHKIDGFRPNGQSRSFSRPVTEKNLASGIPKFCPLIKLRQRNNPYVHDDVMFIKVLICKLNEYMPESAIRDVMTIDPGLPEHIQDEQTQAIIARVTNQEKEDMDQSICFNLPD